MQTPLTKIRTSKMNFPILFFIMVAMIAISTETVYSQKNESHKELGAIGAFLPDADTITTQAVFDYDVELFPGYVFDGWLFYWTLGGPLTADFQENPDVPWLTINPTTFTSDSCEDIVPVSYAFSAPMTPGFYTTTIEDQNGNWANTNVMLTVTNSPTLNDSIFIQIFSGDTVTLVDTTKWTGFGNFSCVSNYIPDSTSGFLYTTIPPVPWLTIQPSDFPIFLNDTVFVQKVFTSNTIGTESTHEIQTKVWRTRPRYIYFTLDVVTGIEEQFSKNLPHSVRLFQNYPNPLNRFASISYSISTPMFVSLKIYDLLGREIKTLVSEFQFKGSYSIDFDVEDLSSGLYLYQLQAGSVVKTKKMLVLK